ncbi:MAG: DUF4274 domain-containing protein [Bacillus sp. (in: Bacteria)]|uniref:DUF4274 domain-containing protein n=1 Tax=Bacillus TaxID=1386 RepID=UPI000CDB543C|nr:MULTISPECIES: DUF4274 domain-containing protein [Bacillus]MBW4886787.1 DUF4274 domain-containing protein [Bacillus sp. (in: firmicutes)]POO77106.1 DUF4274 domain-containing protein [Bacillus sp. MBGLi97]WAJ17009.1 DUF4274 domain-containing protein [Bacillus paralicheniformis]
MKKKDINFLEELLYNTEKDSAISRVRNIDDPLLLHVFAANYNWNSGFEVPKAILENENCDYGTGLLMFHYADGYRMLESPDDVSASALEEWKDFLIQTYQKLINLQFNSQNISFDPEITRVHRFKLKKNNPHIPDALLDKSPGVLIELPKI